MATLSKTIQGAMNEQIKNELYSAYLYLSMSAYCEAANLPGFAHWMRVQAQEEVGHAMKFYDFICERGGRVVLQAIDQPPVEFQSPLHVFEQTLEHEQKVTAMIHDLYGLSPGEGLRKPGLPAMVRNGTGRGGGQRHSNRRDTEDDRRQGPGSCDVGQGAG